MKRFYWFTLFLIVFVLLFTILYKQDPITLKADSPPGTIEIIVPNFIVESTDGVDNVTIPGGIMFNEVGKPYLPFYQKMYNFSSNFSIQAVSLTNRYDIKEGKNLKIPNYTDEIAQTSFVPNVPEGEQKDWFPNKDFEWEIDEKPDGSKMLLVTIYPFYYNAKTTEYKYVQHYKFTVEFIPTLLQVKSFQPEMDVFELGNPVTFTAGLYYQDNKPANLIANVLITDLEKKEVDQLPMIDLSELEGENTNLSIEWKNDKKLAGKFYARIEIRDLEGHLLDFKLSTFRVGRPKLTLTEFTATKGKVNPGDVVGLSIKVQNSAKIPVDGRLLIKISDPEKEIKRFEKEFKGLKAGETLSIQDSWKTLELKKGMIYTLTGIAYYESEATTPIILTLSTNTPPIAKFLTAPALLETGKEITFDATSSSDPDGEIVSYLWDFGDNLTGGGKTTLHLYNIAGTYPVKLKLTDNAGESTVLTVDIKVIAQSVGVVPGKIIIKLYIGQKVYTVNDIKKEMDTEPVIFQGRTLLPIRYVAEALGATVGWVQAEKKATIVLGGTNIDLWIGKNSAKVNGEYKLIDASNPEVKPIVVPPGRTMLPIRFVAETLGCQVDWNQSTKEVKITYPK